MKSKSVKLKSIILIFTLVLTFSTIYVFIPTTPVLSGDDGGGSCWNDPCDEVWVPEYHRTCNICQFAETGYNKCKVVSCEGCTLYGGWCNQQQ